MITVNELKLSKKLREEIPEFKKDTLYKFKLLNLKYDSTIKRRKVPQNIVIPSIDTVFDMGKDSGKGAVIQIECIDRVTPLGPDSQRENQKQYKNIVFSREMQGLMILDGNNPAHKQVYEFLFLSSLNKSNSGKPWHMKPRIKYLFEFLDEETKIEAQLETKEDSIKAQSAVFSLDSKGIRALAKKVSKIKAVKDKVAFSYSEQFSDNVLKNRLIKVAEVLPMIILNNTKSGDVDSRADIDAALEANVIEFEPALKRVVWAETKEEICNQVSGMDLTESLAAHFATEQGKVDYKAMKALITQE